MFIAVKDKDRCVFYFDQHETNVLGLPLEDRLRLNNLPFSNLSPHEDAYLVYFGHSRPRSFLKYHDFGLQAITRATLQLDLVPQLFAFFKEHHAIKEDDCFDAPLIVSQGTKLFSIDVFGLVVEEDLFAPQAFFNPLVEEAFLASDALDVDVRVQETFKTFGAYVSQSNAPIFKFDTKTHTTSILKGTS